MSDLLILALSTVVGLAGLVLYKLGWEFGHLAARTAMEEYLRMHAPDLLDKMPQRLKAYDDDGRAG